MRRLPAVGNFAFLLRACGSARTMAEVVSLLGPINAATVAGYRLGIRLALWRRLTPVVRLELPRMFIAEKKPILRPDFPFPRTDLLNEASELLEGRIRLFCGEPREAGAPPLWFHDPVSGKALSSAEEKCHWADIKEFSLDTGDVKVLWDLSRFAWAPVLARAYASTGDERYLNALNDWVADWWTCNPPNTGVNWRCGQEASLRLMNLLSAADLIGQLKQPGPALIQFVRLHCMRIAVTLPYALAQDNNHGTSEAAALFAGGAVLASASTVGAEVHREGRRWKRRGRFWLENRVRRLVQRDGSFAQHSVIYHRLLLDTAALAEHWRRSLDLAPFSTDFRRRVAAAVDWLFQMTNPETGTAPNLGANDGSRLLRLCQADYRDSRSSLQLGAALFCGGPAYPAGMWDEPLFWLRHEDALNAPPVLRRISRVFPDGGYVTIHSPEDETGSWALIRFPKFLFRPSHADAMHLDLWSDGRNILRDSGSFSYADNNWNAYFSGTAAHNTVQFDGRDQMPRIGRFLFGKWLHAGYVGPVVEERDGISWTGEYRDSAGARHRRTVHTSGGRWTVIDEVEGHREEAVLRWRLIPADWKTDGSDCSSSIGQLRVTADVPIKRCGLVAAWESTLYMTRSEIPCLEIVVGQGRAVLTTRIDRLAPHVRL